MNSNREKYIINNGIVLCTEHFGKSENPAILLIAGATVSMLYWHEEFCCQLARQGFFVIRYDHRDVGKSTSYAPGGIDYTIDDLTDDVIRILAGYQLKKAHILGMSLGGLMPQIMAIKYPARVNRLVLMATGPWGTPDPAIPMMDQRVIDFQQAAENIDWTNEKEVVDYLLKGAELMSGTKPLARLMEQTRIRGEFHRTKQYKSMFNHALLQGGDVYYDRLNEITHPTLIIHGTNDKIWYFGHTAKLLAEIKDAKLFKLEGTGHELHPADWNEIIKALVSFLK